MTDFRHPADVPIAFALAVHRIMHNQAADGDWATVQKPIRTRMEWICAIYEANGWDPNHREREWWLRELSDVSDN